MLYAKAWLWKALAPSPCKSFSRSTLGKTAGIALVGYESGGDNQINGFERLHGLAVPPNRGASQIGQLMYEHGSGKYFEPNNSATAQDADRRGGDRHLVIASAEVVELSSGARFATRTTDLGPGGCFVDTLTPFPVGSKVRVTVYKTNSRFETRGVVVYSQAGLGMGVAFDALEPKQRAALEAWLAELTQGKVPIPDAKQPGQQKLREIASDRTALIRLVQLMVSKGILTESEGSSVFYDPMI